MKFDECLRTFVYLFFGAIEASSHPVERKRIRIMFDFIDLFDIKATIEDSTTDHFHWHCAVRIREYEKHWSFNCKYGATIQFNFILNSISLSGFAMQIQLNCGARPERWRTPQLLLNERWKTDANEYLVQTTIYTN